MNWFSKGNSNLNIIQMNTNMNAPEKKKNPQKQRMIDAFQTINCRSISIKPNN